MNITSIGLGGKKGNILVQSPVVQTIKIYWSAYRHEFQLWGSL
jgi:hypothetical protein